MKPARAPLVPSTCPIHGLPRISDDVWECQQCIEEDRYNRRLPYWLFGTVLGTMAVLVFLAWLLNTPVGRAWWEAQP